ncbi:competence type IV pilus minor pilin ComGG [Bacillus mycoides]|uniref:Competence protein ComG n=1 Tax=Bacillus mycoides TaxID=1405 RepID=A0A653Q3Y5_BACMY|nr:MULTISPECIES: competence type IV pilus minor pilin ComGG [Bacillus]MCQ6564316.1 competence type IV pilus minor pilin ComGG [Bacillus mycoides]NUC16836.1 competence protein ComG [Bacillus mycoides]QWG52250.1 competence protein ComG [Bacillus mycoides]QWG74404.1 competence protein ComG [Bacillus mycoides]QWH24820.1 competence protein ComG [Bacillus mycoides]
MRKQDGFVMPGTIIFLILFISFLMYETNMLLSDKKFYSEIEQSFFMEELVDRAISDIKRDLQQKEKEDVFLFQYERGEVSGKYVFENDVIIISLQCVTKQRVFYTVSFRYREKDNKIFDWVEG